MSVNKKPKLELFRAKCDSLNKDKEFKTRVKVKDETWILTDNFLYREGKGTIKKLDNLDVFILTRNENLINYDLINNKFDELKFDSFESYIECCKHVHVVTFDREHWEKSKCTCWYFMKKYHCYHVFVIAVNERMITVPSNFRNAKIGQKPRVGRKAKAKKGDALKKN